MTMKPEVRKLKNARGRIVGYRAWFNRVSGDGATPQAAATVCERHVREALDRLAQGTRIIIWRGHTVVVSPETDGWRYWVDTFERTDYYVMSAGLRDQTEQAALSHLASSVWDYAVSDDRTFVADLPVAIHEELVSRFQWYRDMRRLTQTGYSDTDARAILAGFKQESCAPVTV